MWSDSTGHWPDWNGFGKWIGQVGSNIGSAAQTAWNATVDFANSEVGQIIIGAGIIVGLGIATALTGGAAGVILGAAFYGALTGAISGAVVGAGIGVATGLITGDWSGMLGSVTSGFMMGALIGGASGALLSGINIATGGVKIIGSAQANSATFFHRMASNVQAGKMAMQIGRYSEIALNTKLKTVGLNGGSLRPDVIGIARNGHHLLVEVTSASQTATQMAKKLERMVSMNPGAIQKLINWAGIIGKIFF